MSFVKENNALVSQPSASKKFRLLDELVKPLYETGSINMNIKRYYTDVDGALIAKASAPAALQVKLPVYMLGNFDRVGAFNIGQKTVQPVVSSKFLMTYVHGYEQPFLWNTGLNTIQAILRRGDIVTVFTDDLDAPSAFVYIVQTVDTGALASIISNTQTIQDDGKSGIISVKNVSLQVDNDNQLNQIWQVMKFDNFGNFDQHPFNPAAVERSPFYKLGDFVELRLQFLMTQYIGIYFYYLYESESININFRLNK